MISQWWCHDVRRERTIPLVVSLPERRGCATYLKTQYAVSERRACEVLSINRSSYRYCARRDPIDSTHREVVRLSDRYDYWGYRKIYDLMQRAEIAVGRERVRLIRRREGLQVRQKQHKRKVLGRSTQWVHRAQHPNHVWSYDFVMDQTIDGRTLKCLTVVDEFTRQGLAVRCARSLTATDVVRILDELIRQHGRPECLRSDNGPEFIAKSVQSWLSKRAVGTHYIDPGSPWQNAYNESFNSMGFASRRHCPEQTALYLVIETNLTPFLEYLQERGAALPRFVSDEFKDHLLRASGIWVHSGQVRWLPPRAPGGLLLQTARLLSIVWRTPDD